MEIDKVNGNVGFNTEYHKYFNIDNPSKEYISVTTLIHKYTHEFDKEFWSAFKSLEKLLPKDSWTIEKKSLLNTKKFNKAILDTYNISELEFNKTQQSILDAWDEENRKSCDRGTKIHEEIETSFYNNPKDISLQKFGLGGKFECRKDYTDLDLEYGVYPEYLIYRESDDGILRLAGQVDLIIKQGNDIVIVDHKGLPLDTPILTSNGWSTMGDLKVGDKVFDKDGNLCSVTVKSAVHHNPCCIIKFDNAESIVADVDHRWLISFKNENDKVMTTSEIKDYLSSLKERNEYNIPRILKAKPINYSKLLSNDSVFNIKLIDRTIESVEFTDTVPTQCIAVDSPSHTYLCTHSLIVTHNTNKKIDLKAGFNTQTKSTVKMKYPLNNLDDSNFWHYTLQLSTYAWMLQKINPQFVIKDLILNHYDHNGNNTLYHCDYLKHDVEKMLYHYKKELMLQERRDKRKRIEY